MARRKTCPSGSVATPRRPRTTSSRVPSSWPSSWTRRRISTRCAGAVAALAARVEEKAAAGAAPHAALCEVLFAEEAFRGDDDDYDQPSNSSVARVLARRRGLPITLSILAIEVGGSPESG